MLNIFKSHENYVIHKPLVGTCYHHFIVSHCEMGDGRPCRPEVKRAGKTGLERKV